MDAETAIKLLGLQPLEPEGGFFIQTFKSTDTVWIDQKVRSALTAIYYLLNRTNFSAFHRLTSTEIYHFYSGGRVELYLLSQAEGLRRVILGSKLFEGEHSQVIVPPGTWQASRLLPGESTNWSLLGTTVTPGFEFDDFELASKDHLCTQFPEHQEIITQLTRT